MPNIKSQKKNNKQTKTPNKPQTSFNRRIGLRNIPGHSSKQRNPMLSSRNRISSGRINHKTPMLGGSPQIHIINPHTSPSNHLESPTRRFKHLTVHFSPTPYNQRVTERDLGAEFLRGQVVRTINICKGF
ncbi:hypothetical protein Hanom_Chr00s000006g01614591 [Helianthus anomalus]